MNERFWSHVDKNGPVPAHRPDLGPCWMWLAARGKDGYGKVKVNGKMRVAHRVAYEENKGPIPDGLDLDHLCRNRSCVNYNHTEPVTAWENTLRGENFVAANSRKALCLRGHELTPENCFPSHLARGERQCKACDRLKYRLRIAIRQAFECGLMVQR
jgi:HNH endonuclease